MSDVMPFTVTGVDLTGVLYVQHSGKEERCMYVCSHVQQLVLYI